MLVVTNLVCTERNNKESEKEGTVTHSCVLSSAFLGLATLNSPQPCVLACCHGDQ